MGRRRSTMAKRARSKALTSPKVTPKRRRSHVRHPYCTRLRQQRSLICMLSALRMEHVAPEIYSGRSLVIFYGSQTGTGEEFAHRISQNARRYGLSSIVCNPEDIDYEELENLKDSGVEKPFIVMCLATYGEGEPTDNFQEMYEWLNEPERDETMLNGCYYAIFGLGNRTYEHFNAMGKKVDKRMEDLGAERLHTLGVGDDNDNIEEHFVKWQEELWSIVVDKFDFDPTKADKNANMNIYELKDVAEDSPIFTGEPYRLGSYLNQRKPFQPNKNPLLAPIAVKTTPIAADKTPARNYMHIEFDTENSGVRYESGDHLAVLAPNANAIVDKILSLLGVNGAEADTKISLEALDEEAPKKHPFPCPTTWRAAFTHYLDITNPPRTNVLQSLIPFCSDQGEQERLKALTKIGSPEYKTYVLDSRRSVVHILEDFPSCRPTAEVVAQLLPKLQPRYYSIASSYRASPTKISILCYELSYTSRANRAIKGVATGYLAGLDVGEKVPIWVRRSQFKLPFRSNFPVIMIGPGTGLAPFRGFLQERAWAKQKGKEVGENYLFTGFRTSSNDYCYETELQSWKDDGLIDHLGLAFSRDGPEKVYVQHHVREHREKIWELLEKGAYVYICGDAVGMAQDVKEELISIVAEKKNGRGSAEDFLKMLRNKGRYCEDVWS